MTPPARSEVCFFERDPHLALARRAGVEAVGTLMLMFAATGSAVVAANFGTPTAAPVLLHALATSGALVGLIIAFGTVSGGHFNPIITTMQWLAGERTLRCTVAYVAGQLLGATAGAILARLVFVIPPIPLVPIGWPFVTSGVIATAGLMIIVLGSSRAKRSEAGPFAVGAWLTGMIMYTPSSYANPALVVGALFAVGPIVLPAHAIALFVPAQILGGLLALWIVMLAYGGAPSKQPDPRLAP
jgi:glycerol uptake facilitator-like aquaporin